MSEHPRMVCRREGHKPTVTITITHATVAGSVMLQCSRCGRWYEQPFDTTGALMEEDTE